MATKNTKRHNKGGEAEEARAAAPPSPVLVPFFLFVSCCVFCGHCLLPAAADRAPGRLPAEKAAKGMVLPPGFRATVFAAEPDVVQPVSFCTDARGRLWVAEALN